MDELEKIKWHLAELANADPESIESDEIEICGEDEQGREGSFTMNITTIAEDALEQIAKLEKVVEAAKLHIHFDLHGYIYDKEAGNLKNRHPATVALLSSLAELTRTPPIKNED